MRLTLDGLGHRFGDSPWLFRRLNASLEPGRVYGLVGPSGSGKSTLLQLIAGWMDPAEGRIERPDGGSLAWVPQLPHGAVHRSAVDHVALPLLAAGNPPGQARPRALALLDRFGVGHRADMPYRTLSGGEAQRLMIARAIAAAPGILLIDEPTAQLDRRTAATVDEAIASAPEEGVITVVATHDAQTRDACTDVIDLEDWQS